MKIVAGLGNPGGQYEGSRHNAGFAVLDLLARREGLSWTQWRFQSAWVSGAIEGCPVALMKPQTYMNRSGDAVREALTFHRIPPQQLLVVFDDFHLPLGTLRFRSSGSSGGQKGMESILSALATQEVPRLRIGIGPVPERRLPESFVLGRFARSELAAVDSALSEASGRVRSWILENGEGTEG